MDVRGLGDLWLESRWILAEVNGSPSADLGQGQDQHWNLDRGTRGAALAGGSCGSTAEVKYSKKHTENAFHGFLWISMDLD